MSDPRTKIRALLVKARHAGTPAAEAELSRNMATKLAAKYGVDLVRLEADLDAPPVTVTFTPRSNVKCATWTCTSMAVIGGYCLACAMDAAFRSSPRPEGERLRTDGFGAPKKRIDHSGCDHEATPAARAKCRRARARAGM